MSQAFAITFSGIIWAAIHIVRNAKSASVWLYGVRHPRDILPIQGVFPSCNKSRVTNHELKFWLKSMTCIVGLTHGCLSDREMLHVQYEVEDTDLACRSDSQHLQTNTASISEPVTWPRLYGDPRVKGWRNSTP